MTMNNHPMWLARRRVRQAIEALSDAVPAQPVPNRSMVVVPWATITELREALLELDKLEADQTDE